MTEIQMNISFPTDDENYFRRQCPLCRKEFKVLLDKKELKDLAKEGIETFMLERKSEREGVEETEKSEPEFTCPYCGQLSPASDWWTDEQKAYIGVYVENIATRLINEELIRPLKRNFGRSSTDFVKIRVDAQERRMKEPWISPETNDMEIFDLPCCTRKIKIKEDWTGKVHCFFCGFPHKNQKGIK
jgi:hypothetical protein